MSLVVAILCAVSASGAMAKSWATIRVWGNQLKLKMTLNESAEFFAVLIAHVHEFDATAVASMLPGSVQLLLTARIDRLSASDRAVLQAASVIGRRFDADAPILPAAQALDR